MSTGSTGSTRSRAQGSAAAAPSPEPDPTLVQPYRAVVTDRAVLEWLVQSELGQAMVTAATNGVAAELSSAEAERRGAEIARLRGDLAAARQQDAAT